MRCNWCTHNEERFPSCGGLFNESEGLVSNEISGVSSMVEDWSIFVGLERRVYVAVGVWIEEEVGRCESIDVGTVVVCDVVRIEEFTCVVGIVAGCLEPDGEEVVV